MPKNWWEEAPLVEPAPQVSQAEWWKAAPLVQTETGTLPADDSLSELRTMSGGMLEGIPIVGPLIRGGVDRAAAGTLSLISGQPYGEVLQTIQQGTAEEKAANPYLDTASQVVGGVAGTVPMIMAAPAAFGIGGGSALARTGASIGTGTALGAGDAAIRSQGDVRSTTLGGAAGLASGALGPAIGSAIGRGAAYLTQRVRPSATTAQTLAAEAAMADGITNPSARLSELGSPAMMMDLGPNLQQTAAGLASLPGEGQQVVRSALMNRDAGANARIRSGVDGALGPSPIPSRVDAEIAGNQGATGRLYEEAFQGARGVDTTEIAHKLESAAVNLRGKAQRSALDVRRMLNIIGTDELDPSPRALFEVRKAIDGLMSTNQDGNVGRVLASARSDVDGLLARAVPGIKDVDGQFAELARQRDALARGSQVLESGRTAPRPAELAQELQEGALPQGMQIGPSAVPLRLSQGARAEIDRVIGTNANDRVALQGLLKGQGDWNRDRLSMLLGPDRADQLLRIADSERVFADTSQMVLRNSETSRRQAAQEALKPSTPQRGMARSAANFNFGDAVSVPIDALRMARLNNLAQGMRTELAHILSSNDPQKMRLAIQAIERARTRGDLSAEMARETIQALSGGNAGKIGEALKDAPLSLPLATTPY